MKQLKLTPWFPNTTPPVRPGVYRVDTPNTMANKWAYWCPFRGWRLCSGTYEGAEGEATGNYSGGMSSMNRTGAKWRGVLK